MKLEHLIVSSPQGLCGDLRHDADGFYLTSGNPEPAAAASLTMPPRARPYASPELHPVLQMNLPEGRVLEAIRHRIAKTAVVDPMLLLSITGAAHPIGRLRCAPDPEVATRDEAVSGEQLADILAWDGAEDLFEELFNKYVMNSGISGVQPKVLVPEAGSGGGTSATDSLIVKSGQDEYPHLAINEYICMSIAREAGLITPEFHLSHNRRLFVMRRFDRASDGTPLGFEDFAVLTGRTPAQKYETSYETVAKAIGAFVSDAHRESSLQAFFRSVALSCMLGNGDAHLKNYGLLYSHTASDDVRLSPAFDIVNTTMYLPDDGLGLSLGGQRSLFASRLHLPELAKACRVDRVARVVHELVEAAHRVIYLHQSELEEAMPLKAALLKGVQQFEVSFPG